MLKKSSFYIVKIMWKINALYHEKKKMIEL